MTKEQVLVLFLQVLIKEAVEDGFFMRKIILVKYLYLLDVYMAQETGQQYTDIRWIFWKFGPYSNTANNLIEKLVELGLVKEKITETRYNRDLVQYEITNKSVVSRDDIWKYFPSKVLIKILNKDLKRFADDTYKLLDYVYFDTEPMRHVQMKDILRFDNLAKDIEKQNIVLKPISNTKMNKIKKMLKYRKNTTHENLFPTFNDTILDEFDRTFFKAEQIEPGSGKVVFK